LLKVALNTINLNLDYSVSSIGSNVETINRGINTKRLSKAMGQIGQLLMSLLNLQVLLFKYTPRAVCQYV